MDKKTKRENANKKLLRMDEKYGPGFMFICDTCYKCKISTDERAPWNLKDEEGTLFLNLSPNVCEKCFRNWVQQQGE